MISTLQPSQPTFAKLNLKATWVGGPDGGDLWQNLKNKLGRIGIEVIDKWDKKTAKRRVTYLKNTNLVILNLEINGHDDVAHGKAIAEKYRVPWVYGGLNLLMILNNLQLKGIIPKDTPLQAYLDEASRTMKPHMVNQNPEPKPPEPVVSQPKLPPMAEPELYSPKDLNLLGDIDPQAPTYTKEQFKEELRKKILGNFKIPSDQTDAINRLIECFQPEIDRQAGRVLVLIEKVGQLKFTPEFAIGAMRVFRQEPQWNGSTWGKKTRANYYFGLKDLFALVAFGYIKRVPEFTGIITGGTANVSFNFVATEVGLRVSAPVAAPAPQPQPIPVQVIRAPEPMPEEPTPIAPPEPEPETPVVAVIPEANPQTTEPEMLPSNAKPLAIVPKPLHSGPRSEKLPDLDFSAAIQMLKEAVHKEHPDVVGLRINFVSNTLHLERIVKEEFNI